MLSCPECLRSKGPPSSKYVSLIESLRALRQCQQVVVPVSVRVRPDVARPTVAGIDDTDFRTVPLRIDDMESIRLGIDALDYLFASPFPARPTEVRDVFMLAFAVRFGDAGDTCVRHDSSKLRRPECASTAGRRVTRGI